jgi:uncharacterized protein YbjT (DUF2867 family)
MTAHVWLALQSVKCVKTDPMIALPTAGLDQTTLRRAGLFAVNIGFAVLAAATPGQWLLDRPVGSGR